MSVHAVRLTFEPDSDSDCDHPPWAWLLSTGPAEEIWVVCTLCGAVPALSHEEVAR